ncbi:MAG TPA: hypothetical protein VF142_23710 [Longimicrobium sp.]
MMRLRLLSIFFLAALAACGGERVAQAAPAGPVDSIKPPTEALAEFRRGLPPVDSLSGGAASRDELVARFAAAVQGSDTAAIAGLVLDRAEYAYLYFPSLQRMNPGLNMQPEVMWMLHGQESLKGVTRVLRRLGGGQARFGAYACEDAPRVEGENRYWHRCAIEVIAPDADTATLQLFGSLLERGGRFKIVSYANDF